MSVEHETLIHAAMVGFALARDGFNGRTRAGASPEINKEDLLLAIGAIEEERHTGDVIQAIEEALDHAGMVRDGEVREPDAWRLIDAEGNRWGDE